MEYGMRTSTPTSTGPGFLPTTSLSLWYAPPGTRGARSTSARACSASAGSDVIALCRVRGCTLSCMLFAPSADYAEDHYLGSVNCFRGHTHSGRDVPGAHPRRVRGCPPKHDGARSTPRPRPTCSNGSKRSCLPRRCARRVEVFQALQKPASLSTWPRVPRRLLARALRGRGVTKSSEWVAAGRSAAEGYARTPRETRRVVARPHGRGHVWRSARGG